MIFSHITTSSVCLDEHIYDALITHACAYFSTNVRILKRTLRQCKKQSVPYWKTYVQSCPQLFFTYFHRRVAAGLTLKHTVDTKVQGYKVAYAVKIEAN